MELQVQKREKFGKQLNNLRKNGLIPAELYGHGMANVHLSVSSKDFQKIFKEAGENTIINLLLDNEKRPVLIYDVQVDPLTDEVLNIDFNQIRLDQKIEVEVPLKFIGEAEGVKAGGILVKAMHELPVESLPNNIPHSIDVNLAQLTEIGKSIYVKDLVVPGDVEVLVDSDTVVASVTEKMSEEKEAALSAEIDVSAVKAETEEKKAEREVEKETAEE